MRCGRAQKLMTAAIDAELAPRRRRALDRHLAGCEGCRRELAATERMLAALETLPMESPLSEGLEQATFRRVRLAAADEEDASSRRWRWLPLPAFALATAAVLVLAVGIVRRTGEPPAPRVVAPAPTKAGGEEGGRAPALAPPPPIARPAPKVVEPPGEPPPDLAAAPEKFMNLPILRNMEKLEHFEAIQTTTLDDDAGTPPGEEQPSNG